MTDAKDFTVSRRFPGTVYGTIRYFSTVILSRGFHPSAAEAQPQH